MAVIKRSWIETGSVLALVGGLALVSLQISQSTEITRVQLDTSVTQNWRTVDATRQSEEFSRVLAKSISQPHDLTLAEFLELDAYYLGVLDQLETLASHVEAGYRDSTLDSEFTSNAAIYFNNAFAQAWVREHFRRTSGGDRDWHKILLAKIEQIGTNSTEASYRAILQDL